MYGWWSQIDYHDNPIFFFKQKAAYEIAACLVGSERCIRDSASGPHAAAVIDSLDYSDCTPAELHAAMELDGVLACAMGRLLLYTDPHPLPARGQSAPVSWAYYWRNWRPGAFKDWTPDQAPPDKWAPYVATAWAALD